MPRGSRSNNKNDGENSDPPPYEESPSPSAGYATTTPRTAERSQGPNRNRRTPEINVVPQWKWTNKQCREWLNIQCIYRFGVSAEQASRIVPQFCGTGPNIYLLAKDGWVNLLGGRKKGMDMYGWLRSVMREKGAVPENINIKASW